MNQTSVQYSISYICGILAESIKDMQHSLDNLNYYISIGLKINAETREQRSNELQKAVIINIMKSE